MISQIVFADITILSCIQYLLCILSQAELGKFFLQSPVLLLLLLPHNPGSSYCLTLEYKYTASILKRCKFVRASVYGQALFAILAEDSSDRLGQTRWEILF